MATVSQRSFTGGELTPSCYARADLAKYVYGLMTCRNAVVQKHGGVANRSGSVFVGEVKDSTKRVRLIGVDFTGAQSFVLEFGNLYMRVIKNGAYVTNTAQNITAITNANPCVVTYAGSDTYANGDEVYISGITGAIGTYLNGRNFKVANVNVGANTFELNYMSGSAVNSTSFGSYTSGGTVAEIYTLTTTYVEADVDDLKYEANESELTIVHPSYAPRKVTRTADNDWAITAITFGPSTTVPDAITASGSAGANTYRYMVTAIDPETREESNPGTTGTLRNISSISTANPAEITTTVNHGYATGDLIGVATTDIPSINGRIFKITVTAVDKFTLDSVNGSGFAYVSGGAVRPRAYTLTSTAAPTSSAPITVSWSGMNGVTEANIYKESNGVFGYIGTAFGTTFSDTGYTADTLDSPPIPAEPFPGASYWPSTVGYAQQRRFFANTTTETERIKGSRTGQITNFTVSAPLQDDDALSFKISGSRAVKHIIDIGKPLVFSSYGVWSLEGDQSGILLPSAINPKRYSVEGSNDLRPLIVGESPIYVHARDSSIIDLIFEIEGNGYRGHELSIFASHLFEGYEIVDWAYQRIPHSVVWAVRSDGVLLGLTYVREHQVWAWHRHDFDGGTVENVCVVPEGTEDVLYVVVNRTIDSRTVRYVEKMATRLLDDIKDAIFLDSEIAYDGRHTGATTMTLSGGSSWLYTETLTLTASASTFTSSMVGDAIHLTGSDGTEIRFTIAAYSSGTVVTGNAHQTVPASMRSVAITTWGRAVDTVTGLWHLEGEEVAIFADGFVVASPNNAAYSTAYTVTNGSLTLDRNYTVVRVGLPYISDVQTLDIDSTQTETLAGKKICITKVIAHLNKTRGLWVGGRTPSDDDTDPLENLYELKIRDLEGYDEPVDLFTGKVETNIDSQWNSNGRVFYRQVDPVPFEILAIHPDGLIPFRQGG